MNLQLFIICLFSVVSSEIIWENLYNYNTCGERTYYIACVEEEWNYAPTGYNIITNTLIAEDDASTWLEPSDDRIGSTYIKAVYRQYTDENFNVQISRSSEWKHLGVLGPLIRGIVGEKIKIFYKNMCSFNTSMHPHGLLYDKFSEGSVYFNNDINNGNIVVPDAGWIYIWTVRENSLDRNPGYSSKLWLYHSHVDEVADIAAGLVGPIIVTRKHKETSKNNLRPKDISHEFISYFILFNENTSPLLDKNIEKYLNLNITNIDSLIENEDFIESNLMHSINGYLFGNCIDCYNMRKNEKVRWYVASLGNELDGPHSPHWHGNTLFDHDEAVDTINIIPATTKTLDMIPDAVGSWLFHCHVFDHIEAGMTTIYKVT